MCCDPTRGGDLPCEPQGRVPAADPPDVQRYGATTFTRTRRPLLTAAKQPMLNAPSEPGWTPADTRHGVPTRKDGEAPAEDSEH
jgi:hypothetical protein